MKNVKIYKRLIACFISFLLAAALCGCGQPIQKEGQKEETPSMFIAVEVTTAWVVVYHRDSKVMYAVSCGPYNGGTFTLLVNSDGTPMLWGG